MRRESIFIITLLCQAVLCLGTLALDDEAASDTIDTNQLFFANDPADISASTASDGKASILKADSGKNYSEMNISWYSPKNDFGEAGRNIGTVVKFSIPRQGWVLKSLQIMGWSPFNNSTQSFSPDKNILIEIRDKDTNLLYRHVDTQNAYFAAARPVALVLDVPPIEMNGDFYVIFYDRGSMYIGMETYNGTGNSFLVANGKLAPAEFRIKGANETTKVNWLIRAAGI